MNKRVAVIGAGPSGLAQLRAFESAADKGADIPEIVCFEKQSDWGGLWNYTWRTGLDEHGDPVHGSMYRYLWSNGPKECLEFADYTFEEHFGRPIGSYPPRAVLWDYIKGRVEESGVRKWVRFNTPVRMVDLLGRDRRNSPSPRMTAPTTSPIPRIRLRRRRLGPFLGAERALFRGLLDLQRPHPAQPRFPRRHGVQGQGHPDHRPQLFGRGHRLAMLQIRREVDHLELPLEADGLQMAGRTGRRVPLLQKVVGKTAHFKDGSTKDVDAIILCTGYLHNFPFLTEDLKLKTANRMWPDGLYQGVVWEKNPKLSYIGMQDQFYTFNMFDAQAWFARDVIMGRIKLPSAEAMAAARREMARARGNARRRRADDLVPGRLHQGADRADRLSLASTSRRPTRPSWSGSTTRARTSWASATTPTAR